MSGAIAPPRQVCRPYRRMSTRHITHNTNGRVNISMHEFDAVLSRLEGKMPWTVLYVPFSVSDEFGTNGRLTVKVRFRSLAPYIQREEINRIEGAKTSQTRMKRISALVEKLS